MYISDFWCGVLAVIAIEYVLLLIVSIWRTHSGKRKGAR